MKLSELYEKLSYGQLSNLALSNDGAGTIVDDRKPQLIVHLNAALLRLYTRFTLLQKDLLIELYSSRTLYPLTMEFAQSNTASAEPHKFIMDGLHDDFTDDVIKILSVFDNFGSEYVLNDVEDFYSLFTPQPNVLQVPHPRNNVTYAVWYQARHPIIASNAAETTNINIPPLLEEALMNYIGSLVYGNMNGQDNLVRSQSLLQQYETICLDVEAKDLVNQTTATTLTKFQKRGFV